LATGTKIAWDALAIATGSKWSGALNLADRKVELSQWGCTVDPEIAGAKSVPLVGAGAVGLGK